MSSRLPFRCGYASFGTGPGLPVMTGSFKRGSFKGSFKGSIGFKSLGFRGLGVYLEVLGTS